MEQKHTNRVSVEAHVCDVENRNIGVIRKIDKVIWQLYHRIIISFGNIKGSAVVTLGAYELNMNCASYCVPINSTASKSTSKT